MKKKIVLDTLIKYFMTVLDKNLDEVGHLNEKLRDCNYLSLYIKFNSSITVTYTH